MDLSKRLKFIANYIDKCDKIIDVGTDHGYIPIYAVKKGICNSAIASDINKEPLDKARFNSSMEGVSNKIDLRLGGGLETIKKDEVQGVIIAGMGGNLIRDILEKDKEKIENCDFIILQPAQNPEVLREYLYNNKYEIITEDICLDENIYYELFKVKIGEGSKENFEKIDYEISPVLIKNNSKNFKGFLENKIEKYERILGFIKDNSEAAENRKKEINDKIDYIKKLIKRSSL